MIAPFSAPVFCCLELVGANTECNDKVNSYRTVFTVHYSKHCPRLKAIPKAMPDSRLKIQAKRVLCSFALLHFCVCHPLLLFRMHLITRTKQNLYFQPNEILFLACPHRDKSLCAKYVTLQCMEALTCSFMNDSQIYNIPNGQQMNDSPNPYTCPYMNDSLQF